MSLFNFVKENREQDKYLDQWQDVDVKPMIRCVNDEIMIYVVVSNLMDVDETAEFLIHNGNIVKTDLTQVHRCKAIEDIKDFYRVYYFDDSYIDVKKVR